jgi:uncharacterized membrane protein HdeD (DUF308 family)
VDDDGSEMRAEAPKPASPPASERSAGEPLGLRAQFGATFEAGKRLLRAHVDLAKAELGDIVGEVKRMVALAGVALGAVLLAGLLLFIGGLLFLGEWLFGSIGWGVLLGLFLLLDVAVIALLLALDQKASKIGSSLVIAVIVGVALGVLFGFDLTHRGWTSLGDSLASGYDPNTRAVLLAVGASAAILGVFGLATGLSHGPGTAVARLLVWALIGVAVGLLTVVSIPAQVGAALGVLATLIAWPIIAARDLLATGVDGDALTAKFIPQATIDLTKETIEWVRARTPLVPKS